MPAPNMPAMTGAHLDLIATRAATATPGPWRVERGWVTAGPEGYDDVLCPGHVDCMAYCYGGTSTLEGDNLAADLAFIVAARDDIPALVAEIRRLRALLDGEQPHT